MLQDMDHMKAICIFYGKVGMIDQLQQSKICVLTVTTLGILMLPTQQDWIVSHCFMLDAGYVLRQTLPHVLSIEELLIYIWQTWDFVCCTPLCSTVWKQTTLDWLTANRRAVGTPYILSLYNTGFISNSAFKLGICYSILTWTKLYIPQNIPHIFVVIFLGKSTKANHAYTNPYSR